MVILKCYYIIFLFIERLVVMAKYQRHKISYCNICGYVDLTEKEVECTYCNIPLKSTSEYFDEICSQLESTNKESVEEYVRQLYVYSDDNFNENTMSDREDNKNISDQIDYFENIIINGYNESSCKCPKCNSSNIQIVPRKWSIITGIFTNKTDRVCVNCMYKW